MRRQIQLLDTTILLNLLGVPFESDEAEETAAEFEQRQAAGVQFHLPIGALVEAAKHVERISDGNQRRQCAQRLRALIQSTLDREAPWTITEVAWEPLLQGIVATDAPVDLVESITTEYLEAGDLLILSELMQLRRNLALGHVELDVWTYDGNLRAAVDAL